MRSLFAQIHDLIERNKQLQAANSHIEQKLLVLESDYVRQLGDIKSQFEQRTLVLEEEVKALKGITLKKRQKKSRYKLVMNQYISQSSHHQMTLRMPFQIKSHLLK